MLIMFLTIYVISKVQISACSSLHFIICSCEKIKSELSEVHNYSAADFNGCPYGPDPTWNITWANTDRGKNDTQRCPGGVDTLGERVTNIILLGNCVVVMSIVFTCKTSVVRFGENYQSLISSCSKST